MLQTAEKGTPRPPPPPPPPPKKKMVTKPTNDANSNNEDQKKVDKYMKYKNMMNLKIPDGEIKEAMENDGLTQNDINRFFEQLFCQFADFSALTTMNFNEMKLESKEPQEVINIGSHAGERAAKYSQMRIMGVSDAAVRSEMIEDKMSQEFIDGFFHNISTISPIKSVSKKSAETQTNSNALSSKSGKVPRPRPASSGFSVSPGIGFAHTSNGNNNQDEFVEVNPMRALSQRGGLSADQNTASRASAPVFARVPSGSVRMAPLYNTAPHSMTVSASSKGVPNVVSEMEVRNMLQLIFNILFYFFSPYSYYYRVLKPKSSLSKAIACEI